jgi:FMN phosphatase YigB (HAD superfamily)
LISDGLEERQRAKLKAAGLESAFDAIEITSGASTKPAPDGFVAIARGLALPAASLAMVGNNPYRDVAGAAAAGYGATYLLARPGALYNFDSAVWEDAATALPDRCLSELRELTLFLRGGSTDALAGRGRPGRASHAPRP